MAFFPVAKRFLLESADAVLELGETVKNVAALELTACRVPRCPTFLPGQNALRFEVINNEPLDPGFGSAVAFEIALDTETAFETGDALADHLEARMQAALDAGLPGAVATVSFPLNALVVAVSGGIALLLAFEGAGPWTEVLGFGAGPQAGDLVEAARPPVLAPVRFLDLSLDNQKFARVYLENADRLVLNDRAARARLRPLPLERTRAVRLQASWQGSHAVRQPVHLELTCVYERGGGTRWPIERFTV